MGAPTGHLPQRSADGILFRNSAHCGYLERLIIARSNIDHTQLLGVGVTCVTTFFDVVPPNVANTLETKRSKSTGAM
jgi:hypothetical protein